MSDFSATMWKFRHWNPPVWSGTHGQEKCYLSCVKWSLHSQHRLEANSNRLRSAQILSGPRRIESRACESEVGTSVGTSQQEMGKKENALDVYPTDRPVWDAVTLAIAEGIRNGETVARIPLPVPFSV